MEKQICSSEDERELHNTIVNITIKDTGSNNHSDSVMVLKIPLPMVI